MSGESDKISWVKWFCSLPGHQFFCEVEHKYLVDMFNYHGLRRMKHFATCWHTIIMTEPQTDEEPHHFYSSIDKFPECARLYGLIHSRYILTAAGAVTMRKKYERGEFGYCPRYACQKSPVLPIGLSPTVGLHPTGVYCPKCEEMYSLPSSRNSPGKGDRGAYRAFSEFAAKSTKHGGDVTFVRVAMPGDIDGAYFGPSFPHIFFVTFPELIPEKDDMCYTPRIFGFAVKDQRGRMPLQQGKKLMEKGIKRTQALMRASMTPCSCLESYSEDHLPDPTCTVCNGKGSYAADVEIEDFRQDISKFKSEETASEAAVDILENLSESEEDPNATKKLHPNLIGTDYDPQFRCYRDVEYAMYRSWSRALSSRIARQSSSNR